MNNIEKLISMMNDGIRTTPYDLIVAFNEDSKIMNDKISALEKRIHKLEGDEIQYCQSCGTYYKKEESTNEQNPTD